MTWIDTLNERFTFGAVYMNGWTALFFLVWAMWILWCTWRSHDLDGDALAGTIGGLITGYMVVVACCFVSGFGAWVGWW